MTCERTRRIDQRRWLNVYRAVFQRYSEVLLGQMTSVQQMTSVGAVVSTIEILINGITSCSLNCHFLLGFERDWGGCPKVCLWHLFSDQWLSVTIVSWWTTGLVSNVLLSLVLLGLAVLWAHHSFAHITCYCWRMWDWTLYFTLSLCHQIRYWCSCGSSLVFHWLVFPH